ncbi:hypothetical protein AB0F15_13650 [Amycolatopsis sp. NPDC026612]|uniref:hypothetical protein n=1 Tax=Amycolatopsis sp. NPDC026612 TaxID=3155466 RepID=UPI00340A1BA6
MTLRKSFGTDFPTLAQVAKGLKLTDEQLGSLDELILQTPKGHEKAAAQKWVDENKAFVDEAFTGL